MLVLYRKINPNIGEFVGYVTYLVTTSLQSLGFTQIISEPTHIWGACLDHIYIRNNQNNFPHFDVLLNSVCVSDHDSIVLYY